MGVRAPGSVQNISLIFYWWANEDLNGGPKDYEIYTTHESQGATINNNNKINKL